MKKIFLLLLIPLFLSACSLWSNEIPNDAPINITIPDKDEVSPDITIPDQDLSIDTTSYPEAWDREIVALFVSKYNASFDDVEVFINDYDLDGFARGMVSLYGGGPGNEGGFLAAKSEGVWVLVFDGNGIWDCDSVRSYNFPEDLAPDCYPAP